MIPRAYTVHQTPYRLRFKIPSQKGDVAYYRSVQEQFTRMEGVERIEVNAVTGGVLLVHKVDYRVIAEYAEANNLFRLISPKHNPDITSYRVVDLFREFNVLVRGFTGGTLDIPGIAFLTLLSAGIYQISRGNFAAPAWYTAFWYSMNIFLKNLPK